MADLMKEPARFDGALLGGGVLVGLARMHAQRTGHDVALHFRNVIVMVIVKCVQY